MIQGDQLYMAVFLVTCKKLRIQFTVAYSSLNTLIFTRLYQNNTAMFSWSPCGRLGGSIPAHSNLLRTTCCQYLPFPSFIPSLPLLLYFFYPLPISFSYSFPSPPLLIPYLSSFLTLLPSLSLFLSYLSSFSTPLPS